jgi:hypothetical protein
MKNGKRIETATHTVQLYTIESTNPSLIPYLWTHSNQLIYLNAIILNACRTDLCTMALGLMISLKVCMCSVIFISSLGFSTLQTGLTSNLN